MLVQDTNPERCCHTAGLQPLEEVLETIKTWPRPALETEKVDLGSAVTRVVAEPVIAAAAVPPHRNSAVDGYGYRAADWPPLCPKDVSLAYTEPPVGVPLLMTTAV